MAYKIVRKPNMNRVYVTGDIGPLRALLSDMRARRDPLPTVHPCGTQATEEAYWVPLHQEAKLRAALKKEAEYQRTLADARAEWEKAKSVIPASYRTRHGATYGGDVVINGEVISEPALDTSKLPWVRMACHETRVRDLTGQSLISGRVMDSETLYRATVADGREIYRIASSHSFGDDLRETYYLPSDLWEQLALAEVRNRNITPESARAWLAQSRGCVGTELYEFAATLQPAPKLIP